VELATQGGSKKEKLMLNKLKEMRESREEGFTLIELLVVIVIIGVLAAIALPIFLNQQKAAAAAAVKSDVRNAVTSVSTALVKNPTAKDGAATGVAPDIIPATTTLADAVAATPKSANVTLTIGATQSGGTVSAAKPAWDSYAIVGKTSADTTFWYAFDSTSGKYTQN
jgi:type IV pilus assembly protein PilA